MTERYQLFQQQQANRIRPPTNYRGGLQPPPGSRIRPPTQYPPVGPPQRPGAWCPANIRPGVQPPPGFVSSLRSPSRVRSTNSAANVCPTTPTSRQQNAQSNRGRRRFQPQSYQPRNVPVDSPEPCQQQAGPSAPQSRRVCPRATSSPRTIDYGTPPPVPYRPNLSNIAEDPQGEYCTPPPRQNEAPPRVYPWDMERPAPANQSNPFEEYNMDESLPENFNNKLSAWPDYINVFTPPPLELRPLIDGADDYDDYMPDELKPQFRALRYGQQIRDKKYDEMKDHVADICGPRISMPHLGIAAKKFDYNVTPPNRREVQRPRDSCVPAFSEFKLVNQGQNRGGGCLFAQPNQLQHNLFTLTGQKRPPMRESQLPEPWPENHPPYVQRPEPKMGFQEKYRNVCPPQNYRFKSPPRIYNQYVPDRYDTPKIIRKKNRPPLNKPLRDAPKLQDEYIDHVYEDAVAKLKLQKEKELAGNLARDQLGRELAYAEAQKKREKKGGVQQKKKETTTVENGKQMHTLTFTTTQKAPDGRIITETHTATRPISWHPAFGPAAVTSLNKSKASGGSPIAKLVETVQEKLDFELPGNITTDEDLENLSMPGYDSMSSTMGSENLSNVSAPSMSLNETKASSVGGECLNNVSAPSMSLNETKASSMGGENLSNVSAPSMSFNESTPGAAECKLVDISEPSLPLNESKNSSKNSSKGGECIQDVSAPLMEFDDTAGSENLNNVSAPAMAASPGAGAGAGAGADALACPNPQSYSPTPHRSFPIKKRNLFREMSADETLPLAFQTLTSEHPYMDVSMTSPERGEGSFCLPTGPRPK